MIAPTDEEFARSLQVGDRWTSVFAGTCGLVERRHTVERMTDASIWIDGNRYSRRTGAGIPRPATPEQLRCAREDAERNALVRLLMRHDWRVESLETLRSIAELLKERKP